GPRGRGQAGAAALGGVTHGQEGHIARVPGWTGHAGGLYGASELLQEVLGPRAGHARAVFGQVSLPMNASIELVVTASVGPASSTPSADCSRSRRAALNV